MNKYFNWFLTILLISTSISFAQSVITGKILDKNNKPVTHAMIEIVGNRSFVKSDVDGSFSIVSKEKNGVLIISYLGYESLKFNFSGNKNIGSVAFKDRVSEIEAVFVKSSTIDIAKNRKSPVAVSTVKTPFIQDKMGNQEFPEILNNTPSVYASKTGGGFGDSRITVRGFDQRNIAVLVNGVPINDMENSAVFWANYAGMSDVTTAMQVQRGLGSSKLAISSVGGTVNILTKTASKKQGGAFSTTFGNDMFQKNLAAYNTGKLKNGFSASFLVSRTTGDGYADGTKFEGSNYFLAFGYELNDKHDFQFTFTGAPQWHNQRFNPISIDQHLKYGNPTDMQPNLKYNSDWGYLNGKEYSFYTNFYHKPVASFNWDYNINHRMKLSTVLYASWGRGGGSSATGSIRGNRFSADNLRKPDGTINVDFIEDWNSGLNVSNGSFAPAPRETTNGIYQNINSTSNSKSNGISKILSVNSHNWYGGIVNLNTKLSNKLVLDFGLDARTYKGIHNQVLNDLLGATNFNNGLADINNPRDISTFEHAALPHGNPFWNASHQKAINFNEIGLVKWLGVFSQLEYSTEKFTVFLQGAASNQGFKKIDYFKYLPSDPLSSTVYKNILGGNVKAGVNFNLNSYSNFYINSGYYSKQPAFNAIYINNASVINNNLVNEKVLGLEAGYGFSGSNFSANINLYRTSWKDRFLRVQTNIDHDFSAATALIPGSAFLEGVEQIHSGAELDFVYKPFKKLELNGMFSYGDWRYGSNVTASYQDDQGNVITNPTTGKSFEETLYIDGLKVGNAPQTTAALGFNYEVVTRLKLDANYRYSDRLYADINPANFKKQEDNDNGSLLLPSFGLLDLGISYKLQTGKLKEDSVNFILNVNNVLDKTYISESRSNQFTATETEFNSNTGNGTGLNPATGVKPYANYQDYLNRGVYNGVDTRNRVFFGFGRTFNFSVTYRF